MIVEITQDEMDDFVYNSHQMALKQAEILRELFGMNIVFTYKGEVKKAIERSIKRHNPKEEPDPIGHKEDFITKRFNEVT